MATAEPIRGTTGTTDFLARPLAATKFEIRNPKSEYRNSKHFQMTKNSMLQTLRKPHLIKVLQLCILKNVHKKQEVDG